MGIFTSWLNASLEGENERMESKLDQPKYGFKSTFLFPKIQFNLEQHYGTNPAFWYLKRFRNFVLITQMDYGGIKYLGTIY